MWQLLLSQLAEFAHEILSINPVTKFKQFLIAV